MKRTLCAFALCAALLTALPARTPFRPAARALLDVDENDWYAPAVAWCVEHGLMQGVSPRYFGIGRTVTRAEAVTALYRLAGSPEDFAENVYYDVPADAWYAPAVLWARGAGLTSGVSPHYFGADTPVTREQLALFLYRAAAERVPTETPEELTDAAEVSPWAAEAVAWARALGVMQDLGKARFAPKALVTRAQLAQVLMDAAGAAAGEHPAGPSGPWDAPAGESRPPDGTAAAESGAAAGLPPLCAPVCLAEAADGALLVTDSFFRAVWALKDGECVLLAGNPDSPADIYGQPAGGYHDAAAAESLFALPWGVAPFLDGWAVADAGNNAVRLLRGGSVETVNALPRGSARTAGTAGISFRYPTGLAADGDGNLYVADTHAGMIRKITPEGEASVLAEKLNDPTGLCWAGGALLCAETGANRVLRISPDGKTEALAGSCESGFADGAAAEARFAGPQGVAAAEDGAVYIADTANGAVRRLRGGTVDTLPAAAADAPVSPTGLLLRGERLYVCDRFAKRIIVLDLTGGGGDGEKR